MHRLAPLLARLYDRCLAPAKLRTAPLRFAAGVVAMWLSAPSAVALDGVPLTRFYPYEEIGCAAGGAQLVHDACGRIVVVRDGELVVLNDSVWRKVWSGHGSGGGLRQVARDRDGTVYFGGLGGWGRLRLSVDGSLEPEWLAGPEAPAWVRATIFDKILCAPEGVYFGGLHGVVFRERATGLHHFFEIGGVSCLFPLRGSVLVSTFDDGLHSINAGRNRLDAVDMGDFDHQIVLVAAGDGSDGSLVGSAFHQLFIQQEVALVPLPGRAAQKVPGRIVSLLRLPEDRYAAAIAGFGIITIREDGEVRTLLSGPEYEGITSLANDERGVLWAATERGVIKILYGQPLTTFDRTLGLPIEWPQTVFWRGAVIVASGGRIYEAEPGAEFRLARFRRIAGEPPVGAWGIARVGDSLLLGNGDGVFETLGGGSFRRVVSDLRVGRLVALDDDTFLAIGTERIAAFRRTGDGWAECASRVAGVGYPYIVHAAAGGAWLELGVNRVARVSLGEGGLQVRLFEEFPWKEGGWINVSVVGATAVLCGASDVPLLLDDRTLQPVEMPMLREIIERVPWRVQRVCRTAAGDLWISHERGLCLARRKEGGYEVDVDSYAGVNGPTPLVSLEPDGEGAWASTGSSLHHLEPRDRRVSGSGYRPVLMSLREVRANETVAIAAGGASGDLGALRYEQNGLQLDFFSGSYASVRTLSYEHRLDGGAWQRAGTASSLVLPGLREGRHTVLVRLVDDVRPVGRQAEFSFSILPPWYRRWYAYLAYVALFAAAVGGAVRLAALWARRRNAALERLVAKRTHELRAAMDRLERETLTSATLAERNRLAAEIHDSLEQGFAGLGLQLETTASLGGCSREVQAGLAAARNMVAYCHQEVRHAVQGMRSPILESVDLGTALIHLAAQLAPTRDFASLRVEGEPRRIDPATEHHLLRIAQEAIANAVKHAAARRLEIVLAYSPEAIVLRVRDDGRGFDTAAVLRGASGHLGVPSLRNRAAKIGGTIDISSRPGQGTTIQVSVPAGKCAPNQS